MPRSIWNGAISFGLVNVPVQLFSAQEQKDVHFHQFQEGTGERIKYKRVAEESGKEVDYGDIVKGYEVDKGRFVMVTPEELEAVEPGKSRTIDIEDFIDLEEVDPVYFEHTYYVAPQEGAGADRAYALLREAMRKSRKVAIGRFVMRTKQYLAAIRARGDVLVLETMYFPDEVRDPKDVPNVPRKADVTDRELKIADQLVRSLTTEWDPDKYHDTYRERVLELIEKKAKGEEIVVERRTPDETEVVDLMAALEASLKAAKGQKGEKGAKVEGTAFSTVSKDNRLGDLSRDELYELASEKHVKGRSKMSKDELVDALRRAG